TASRPQEHRLTQTAVGNPGPHSRDAHFRENPPLKSPKCGKHRDEVDNGEVWIPYDTGEHTLISVRLSLTAPHPGGGSVSHVPADHRGSRRLEVLRQEGSPPGRLARSTTGPHPRPARPLRSREDDSRAADRRVR